MKPSRCLCFVNSTFSRKASSSGPPTPRGPFSRPQDALTDAEKAILTSPPLYPYKSSPPPSSPDKSTQNQTNMERRRDRKQFITSLEAEAFSDLLQKIFPRSKELANQDRAAGKEVGQIEAALSRRMASKGRGLRMKKAGEVEGLSREQEEELAELKDVMGSTTSDYELLAWSSENVFGVTLNKEEGSIRKNSILPDIRSALLSSPSPSTSSPPRSGPSSPFYPYLLPALFKHLQTSPTLAAYIFHLSTLTPESYVRGCTPHLYALLLRLRWTESADIEGVLSGLEEMRGSGVRVESGIKKTVEDIGVAIRRDQEKAERRGGDEHRYFSEKQVEAWSKMEEILEEVATDFEKARAYKMDVERQEWERRTREREERDKIRAREMSPSLFKGGLREGAWLVGGEEEVNAERYVEERRRKREMDAVEKVRTEAARIWKKPIE